MEDQNQTPGEPTTGEPTITPEMLDSQSAPEVTSQTEDATSVTAIGLGVGVTNEPLPLFPSTEEEEVDSAMSQGIDLGHVTPDDAHEGTTIEKLATGWRVKLVTAVGPRFGNGPTIASAWLDAHDPSTGN